MESLHPLVVHFPIALLLAGALTDLLAWLLKRPALHQMALWNLGLGAVAAGVAVATGLRAQVVAKHSFEIWQVMEVHERLGISTLLLSLLLTGWRLQRRNQLAGHERRALAAGWLALCGCVVWGAYLGGRLVYEFGVGGAFGR